MNVQSFSDAVGFLDEAYNGIFDLKEVAFENYDSDKLRSEYLDKVRLLYNNLIKLSYKKPNKQDIKKAVSIAKLGEIIYETSGFSEKELTSYVGRKRKYVQPKQVHMALLHKIFGVSQEVAGLIYAKDHATVIHAFKTVRNLHETDFKYRVTYETAISFCMQYDKKATTDFLNGK